MNAYLSLLYSQLEECVKIANTIKNAGFPNDSERFITPLGDIAFTLQCDDKITLDEMYAFHDAQNARIRDLQRA